MKHFQHDTWRKRLEVDVAAKEAELQALKDARNVDRRLLGIFYHACVTFTITF
jgi:hypothetical protein